MSKQVCKPQNVNMSQITFSEPKILPNGGKNSYLNYNGGMLVLQTPKMSLPWNMSCWRGPNGDQPPKYSIDLSFKGEDVNPKLTGLLNFTKELDKKMLEAGVENSLPWFTKKNMSPDVVEALYSPMLKLSVDKNTGEPNGKYPPSIKVRVPNYDGNFTLDVFDNKREKVDAADLENILVRGCEVRALIECSSVWFAGGKYGLSWRIAQLEVTSNGPSNLSGYAFVDSESDSNSDSDVSDSGVQVVNNASTNSNFVEDSDSDSDIDVSESEPEPEPSPKKKSKKKSK